MNQQAFSKRLRLLRTEPHSCSYLKDRIAVTEFVAPEEEVDTATYQGINELSFRRSGAHFYRPNCPECQECKPLRVDVEAFHPNRSQRRCQRRNLDLRWSIHEKVDADRYYPLYESYIGSRHGDGDMYPATPEQFDSFIGTVTPTTRFVEVQSDRLMLVAVCDLMPQGISSIYSFFDTNESHRSLGTLAILIQIQLARSLGLPWLYLGYWIENSSKMAYKRGFKPCQTLIDGRWRSLESVETRC